LFEDVSIALRFNKKNFFYKKWLEPILPACRQAGYQVLWQFFKIATKPHVILGGGSFYRPACGAKKVRTIFKIQHFLEKSKFWAVPPPAATAKSYGFLKPKISWRFCFEFN